MYSRLSLWTFYAIWCFLINSAFGQQSSGTVELGAVIDKPKLIGNVLFAGPQVPAFGPKGHIEVNPEAIDVEVSAFSLPDGEIIAPRLLEPLHYVIEKQGTWIVTVFGSKVTGPKQYKLMVGTPGPNPNPDPTPDPNPNPNPTPIPVDAFDNLGQRMVPWIKGKPDNGRLAILYFAASESLRKNPSVTVNSVNDLLKAQLLTVPNYLSNYVEFRTQINLDISKRQPMSKGILADYFSVISNTLKGVGSWHR